MMKKGSKIRFGWPNKKLLHLLLFKKELKGNKYIKYKKKDTWVLFIEVLRVKKKIILSNVEAVRLGLVLV